jgi:GTP-binding protein HflX
LSLGVLRIYCYNTLVIITSKRRRSIPTLHGHLTGLKAGQTQRLEHLYRRRIPPDKVITPELARTLAELSREIGRQIGLIVTRRGEIYAVIVGEDREILIPDLSKFRAGRFRLRGVRCLHTHLDDSPLTQDDFTDLALLRLDLMAVIGVLENGLPGHAYLAHLIPPNPEGRTWEVHPAIWTHQLNLDFQSFVTTTEDDLARHQTAYDVKDQRERAILASASTRNRLDQEESMEELAELARTDHLVVVNTVTQRPKTLHPKYLMGQGKIKELIITAYQQGADLIVFDQNLTPLQVKAIGEITEMKVIDRTQLILDIFARRAHSRDGKVQVELAQLKYRLPRLQERSTALSRLTGGIGGRGPGETRLEVDRRRARDRISRLEKELQTLSRARTERRAMRVKSKVPIISIIGYTNAGKSTLLNTLTHSEVLTDDLLFATLDTTSRRLRFPREKEVIITDTVGFIRELPEDLMGAFAPTLDELRDAHLLLHLVDIGNPRFEQQIEDVVKLLRQLELDRIPRLVVFNKEDRIDPQIVKEVCRRYDAVSISALHPETLPKLLAVLEDRIFRSNPSLP